MTSMLDQVGKFIGTVGFPVFVAIYVLLRLEPTIKELRKTVMILTVVVARGTGISYEDAKRFIGENGGE